MLSKKRQKLLIVMVLIVSVTLGGIYYLFHQIDQDKRILDAITPKGLQVSKELAQKKCIEEKLSESICNDLDVIRGQYEGHGTKIIWQVHTYAKRGEDFSAIIKLDTSVNVVSYERTRRE